jgi:hypothetical protein
MDNNLIPKHLIPKPDNPVSPFRAYAQAVKARRLDGKRGHFDKGAWLKGENDVIERGTQAVAIMPELRIGWQYWCDGSPGEERTGLLSEGFVPPKRHELGDLDQALWERKPDGSPKDPWANINILPLILLETSEVVSYTTSSKGGFAALGALCESFDTAPEGSLPVIAFESSFYQHKSFGRVYIPVLKFERYVEGARFVAILTSERGEQPAQPIEQKGADPQAVSEHVGRLVEVTTGRQSAPDDGLGGDYGGHPIDDDIPF